MFKHTHIRLRSDLGLVEGMIREVIGNITLLEMRLTNARNSKKKKLIAKVDKEAKESMDKFRLELNRYNRKINRIKMELGEINGINKL